MSRYSDRNFNTVWTILVLYVVVGAVTLAARPAMNIADLLAMTREGLLKGELWRLVSYPFIASSPICWFFSALVFYYIAAPLEAVWGSRRFLTVFLVSIVGGALTAAAFDIRLANSWGVATTLMLIHGFMFPDSVLYVFLVLPMRVKTVALLTTAGFLTLCVFRGLEGLVLFSGLFCGVLYYVITTRSIPWTHGVKRRVASGSLNPLNIVRSHTQAQAMERARAMMRQRDAGKPLTDDDRAFLSELLSRAGHDEQICSPYSFSPDNTICPPCKQFGRCLKRYLEAEIEPVVGKK